MSSIAQGKKKQLNKTDLDSFAFLLKYIKATNNNNNILSNILSFSVADALSIHDQLLYLLINFRKEFYQCYSLHSHLEARKDVWIIRKYDVGLSFTLNEEILQKRILDLKEQIKQVLVQKIAIQNCKTFLLRFDSKIYLSFHFHFANQSNIFKTEFVLDPDRQTIAVSSTLPVKKNKLLVIFAKTILNLESLTANKNIFKNNGIFDLPLLLKQLITEGNANSFFKSSGVIKGFYINKLTLHNLFFPAHEITLDAKHQGWIQRFSEHLSYVRGIIKNAGVKNCGHYLLKSAELVAIIKLPHLTDTFHKRCFINNQGQTDLGFENVD